MARNTQAAALLLFVVGLCLVANSNAQERSLQQITPGPFTYSITTGSPLNLFLVQIGAPASVLPSDGTKSLTGILSFFNITLPFVPTPVTTTPNTWTRLVSSATGLSIAFCNGVTARTIVTSGACSSTAANSILASIPVNTVLNTVTNQVTVNLCGPDQTTVANRPCTGWLCVSTAAAATTARALCS